MNPTLEDHLQIADALLASGDINGALDRLAEAVRAAPGNPLPYVHRAELLTRLGGTANLKQAWMSLVRAITLGLQTPEVHLSLMRTLIALGDWDAAQSAYDEALALAPDDARVRDWGIRLATERGDLAQALRLARHELAARPGGFHWMRRVAELLLAQQSYQEARDAFDALLAAYPPPEPASLTWEAAQWGELYLKRADASFRLGETGAAAADLNAAEGYVPDEPGLAFMRGLIAWADGTPDNAFPLLQRALASAAPAVRAAFMTDLDDYPRLGALLEALEETSSND